MSEETEYYNDECIFENNHISTFSVCSNDLDKWWLMENDG